MEYSQFYMRHQRRISDPVNYWWRIFTRLLDVNYFCEKAPLDVRHSAIYTSKSFLLKFSKCLTTINKKTNACLFLPCCIYFRLSGINFFAVYSNIFMAIASTVTKFWAINCNLFATLKNLKNWDLSLCVTEILKVTVQNNQKEH